MTDGSAGDRTQLRYEVADGVATLTLDRPQHRNAFSGTMADEIAGHVPGIAAVSPRWPFRPRVRARVREVAGVPARPVIPADVR